MFLIASAAILALGWIGPKTAHQSEVVAYGNLVLYPIAAGLSTRPADVITLDEGIKQGTVVITESGSTPPLLRSRPGGNSRPGFGGIGQSRTGIQMQGYNPSSQVNTLWLTNSSGKTLLLIAGEMVVGGQQDRIIQKDGLIPPSKEPVDLAVFCVEHGRWSGQSSFGVSVVSADPALAGGMGGGAFAAPGGGRGAAEVAQSQSVVWDKVAKQTTTLGNDSATGTYRANYVSAKTSASIAKYVQAIDAKFPIKDAAGVVVAVNHKLVWMDRFDSKATFAKYWPKLLKSYALEAMAEPGRAGANPSYAEAMKFAESREGNATFEGTERLSKLTRIETPTTVLYELEDLQADPPIVVHANKVAKIVGS